MKIKHGLLLGAVLGLATSWSVLADDVDTAALDLIKKGNDYVGIQSKDKVLEVYSDKSVSSLEPNIWYVVYYDPSVFSKTVEVKFEAGEQRDVTHPMHPFQLPAKPNEILDLSKVTVNSDRALDIATSQPVLKGLRLRYTKMTLQSGENGLEWKVQIWSAKVNDPTKDANIGSVTVSAINGNIIDSDLRPSNAT
jgi:hypothetical protein